MITVTLTWYEYAHATQVALSRFIASKSEQARRGRISPYEADFTPRMLDDIQGACGELAWCKSQGIYWDGSVDRFHAQADVGLDVEIRSTTNPAGCLLIRAKDPVDRRFVLVTGQPPNMEIRGWIWGSEARQGQWERDPGNLGPAWFVPQRALTPFKASTAT